MANEVAYRRVLLKLSGEALMGGSSYGVDPEVIKEVSEQILGIQSMGVEIAIVIGGGNIFRGVSAAAGGMDRSTGDYMGMLATVMNALALQQGLEKAGADTRVMTGITMREVAEPYIRRRAMRHLEKGRIIILAAGTGLPYFTTDTAAALRALEIGAELLIKATKVDGVYDCDPVTNPGAIKYERVSFSEVLEKNLRVMDATAISLARDNNMPIIVFNLRQPGNMEKAMKGEPVGTLVEGSGHVG